jgi:hypothetical protein
MISQRSQCRFGGSVGGGRRLVGADFFAAGFFALERLSDTIYLWARDVIG